MERPAHTRQQYVRRNVGSLVPPAPKPVLMRAMVEPAEPSSNALINVLVLGGAAIIIVALLANAVHLSRS
jgi:hypothetical protein